MFRATVNSFPCVFYPLSALPVWAQYVARMLPSMYLFEAMRAMLAGRPVNIGDVVLSFALNALYLTLSVVYFYRTFRHAKKNGLLTKPF